MYISEARKLLTETVERIQKGGITINTVSFQWIDASYKPNDTFGNDEINEIHGFRVRFISQITETRQIVSNISIDADFNGNTDE